MLIGILVGAEREIARTNTQLGLRDFVLASALGWLGGYAAGMVFAIVVLVVAIGVVAYHRVPATADAGVTTEFALIVTYVLCYVVGTTTNEARIGLLVALGVFTALLLDAKRPIKRMFSELITGRELADIVRFLAIIFIVLPLLPEGRFGPFGFFAPRMIWTSVILVASVSFVGYFLEKFLGPTKGEWLLAVLGGMVSTTVMTQRYARNAKATAVNVTEQWKLATLSNSIQFPRLLLLTAVVAPSLAASISVPLLSAFVAGIALSAVLPKSTQPLPTKAVSDLQNPLRLLPALQFAAFLLLIALIGGASYAYLGNRGLYATSAIGALMDVDAVTLTTADRVVSGSVASTMAITLIIIAVSANMLVKLALARISGTIGFLMRLIISYAIMIGAALIGMFAMLYFCNPPA